MCCIWLVPCGPPTGTPCHVLVKRHFDPPPPPLACPFKRHAPSKFPDRMSSSCTQSLHRMSDVSTRQGHPEYARQHHGQMEQIPFMAAAASAWMRSAKRRNAHRSFDCGDCFIKYTSNICPNGPKMSSSSCFVTDNGKVPTNSLACKRSNSPSA